MAEGPKCINKEPLLSLTASNPKMAVVTALLVFLTFPPLQLSCFFLSLFLNELSLCYQSLNGQSVKSIVKVKNQEEVSLLKRRHYILLYLMNIP